MKSRSFERQGKVKIAFGVLAVGVIVSVLVAVILIVLSRMRPHY